jgi:pSer/pThr/pTyr-binding forkhead associated (FHA) protein
MPINLTQLESHLQALIEGSADRLFPSARQRQDLSALLVAAMRQGIQNGQKGGSLAPNLYTLLFNPVQVKAILSNPGFVDNLASVILQWGKEAGLSFVTPPIVRVAASPQIGVSEIQVLAQHSQQDLSNTSDMTVEERHKPSLNPDLPTGAFLIIDGVQIVNLTQSVVNIGRRPDNQIVITDLRVSRQHAQVRAVKGRFIIFDLGSTGGTSVNGKPVQQSVLTPGDVISVGGIPLVYGQERPIQGETQTMRPHEPKESDSSDPSQRKGRG